ncbi:hypothetical protein PS6_010696 [Mucor atramentarius]
MPFPSLFSICFDYIKEHTEDIVSLEGIPFNPVVENLIQYLFTSDTPLNSSILSVIAESHSKELREAQLTWSSLLLSKAANRSAVPALTAISKHFPKFITCLKLGQSNINDQDIFLLRGFTNLKTLHLGKNSNITDRGILYLTSIISAAPSIGLPYLEDLHLNDLPGITDKSLKFIGKIPTLVMAFQYDQGQVPKPLTVETLPNSSQPILHFSRILTKNTAVVKEETPPIRKKPIAKKQKLTTNDYLAMFEQEIADDD